MERQEVKATLAFTSVQHTIPSSLVSKTPQPEMLVEADFLDCLEVKKKLKGWDDERQG